jgi:hypothetical protein
MFILALFCGFFRRKTSAEFRGNRLREEKECRSGSKYLHNLQFAVDQPTMWVVITAKHAPF